MFTPASVKFCLKKHLECRCYVSVLLLHTSAACIAFRKVVLQTLSRSSNTFDIQKERDAQRLSTPDHPIGIFINIMRRNRQKTAHIFGDALWVDVLCESVRQHGCDLLIWNFTEIYLSGSKLNCDSVAANDALIIFQNWSFNNR